MGRSLFLLKSFVLIFKLISLSFCKEVKADSMLLQSYLVIVYKEIFGVFLTRYLLLIYGIVSLIDIYNMCFSMVCGDFTFIFSKLSFILKIF